MYRVVHTEFGAAASQHSQHLFTPSPPHQPPETHNPTPTITTGCPIPHPRSPHRQPPRKSPSTSSFPSTTLNPSWIYLSNVQDDHLHNPIPPKRIIIPPILKLHSYFLLPLLPLLHHPLFSLLPHFRPQPPLSPPRHTLEFSQDLSTRKKQTQIMIPRSRFI